MMLSELHMMRVQPIAIDGSNAWARCWVRQLCVGIVFVQRIKFCCIEVLVSISDWLSIYFQMSLVCLVVLSLRLGSSFGLASRITVFKVVSDPFASVSGWLIFGKCSL